MPAKAGTERSGLAEQVAQELAQRIEQRLLLPGARLPSVRAGAQQRGVSPSTVVAAYDRLQAQGLVEARHKRGFFVREPRRMPTKAPPTPAWPSTPFDALTLMRGLMTSGTSGSDGGGAHPSPAHGTLAHDWLDAGLLRQALRQVLARGDEGCLLSYGDPQGDPALREALAHRLEDLGLHATPQQHILTTSGATHALDLVTQQLTAPGDAVLVDDPGWPIEFARLSQLGLRLLAVPRTAQGPDLAVLGRLLEQHKPRLYLTVSVLHNPTGQSLALAQAHELLRLTEARGCVVVEDDTYAAFAPAHQPRLAALDGLRRSVYVSGFSKMLGAGLRVGFVAAAPDLIARLTERKLVQQLSSPALTERALALLLQRGALRRHAERVNERLAQARARCQRLAEQAGCRFHSPPAGLFGWVHTGCDSERLAQQLALQGVRIAPEPLFNPTRRAGPHMRVNFAASATPHFWRALEHARAALPAWACSA